MRENLTINDLPNISEEERNWWNEHNDEYYHYFYRIDNLKNGKFYYGIHSQRKDSGKIPENDGYMGSGVILNKAQKKFGIENFKKTIIKTFSTRDEARHEKMRVVDEDLVNDDNCYNLTIGGGLTPSTVGFGVYMNIYNNKDIRQLSINDPLVLSGDFVGVSKGMGVYRNKDDDSDIKQLQTDDNLVTSGQYISITAGFSVYKNKDNPNDIKQLATNDQLVLSGQYIGISKGTKRTREEILKLTGKRNGKFGTMWITNGNEEKQINKENSIPDGWWRGKIVYRKCINIKTREIKILSESKMRNSDWVPVFLFDNSGMLITKELVINLYKMYNNWELVRRKLSITTRRLVTIRKYYEIIN